MEGSTVNEIEKKVKDISEALDYKFKENDIEQVCIFMLYKIFCPAFVPCNNYIKKADKILFAIFKSVHFACFTY